MPASQSSACMPCVTSYETRLQFELTCTKETVRLRHHLTRLAVSLFGCIPRLSVSKPFLFLFQLTVYFPHKKSVWVLLESCLFAKLPPVLLISPQALEYFCVQRGDRITEPIKPKVKPSSYFRQV